MGAKITANPNYPLNFDNIDFSIVYNALYYRASSTFFGAYSGIDIEFRGVGFKYDSNGVPSGGTVTSIKTLIISETQYSFTNISVPVTSLVKVAGTSSKADDLALIVKALNGDDALKGSDGQDRVYTYAGNDVLDGKGHDDHLYAGSGNDLIRGGVGKDYLYGGSGSDTFIYKSVSESAASYFKRDTIFDLTSNDKIDIHAIDANTTRDGNQTFIFIGTSAFTGKPGELRYTNAPSNSYIYGDVNGDKTADFSVHLDDVITLTKGYFVL